MSVAKCVENIRTQQRFFNTGTNCFDEADSNFAPKPGMFTVAQHIAHTARLIEKVPAMPYM